jgi:hypothetical protein
MKQLIQRSLLALCFVLLTGPLAGRSAPMSNQPAGATKRMLVIAPNLLHPALKEFLAYKQKLLPTEFRSLESILKKTSGVDDPEKLKRFLYSEWRERRLGYVLLVGARRLPDSDCMFPATRGEADSIGSLRGTFELVRQEAGLPDLHFHDARHHFISECVMSGVDFLTIAKWVGHADGGMLIGKVYGHLSNEHTQRAAKKVTFGNGGRAPKIEVTRPGNPGDLTVEELLQLLKQKTVKQ